MYVKLLDPSILARSPLFPGLTEDWLWEVLQALNGVRLVDLVDPAPGTTTGQAVAHTAVLHYLVRATNRAHRDITDDPETYRALLVDLLNHAIADLDPADPSNWVEWHALAPHCPSPLRPEGASFDRLAPAQLSRLTRPAHQAARYLQVTAVLAQAEAAYREVLDFRWRTLGEEHPDTLNTRFRLARTFQNLGHHEKAEEEYLAVLALLGDLEDEDRTRLDTLRHLAGLLRDGDRFDEAEAQYQVVLDHLRLGRPGHDDPDALSTRHDITYALQARAQRPLSDIEAEYRQVFETQRRTLGAVIEREEREEEPGLEPGRDRAIRLFEYLRRLAELRTPTVRDVAAYPEVVWFGEVTRVPPSGPLQWLTIDRPRRSPLWTLLHERGTWPARTA
jgi:tetratricopeptide (TPR) repeat protein